MPEAVRVISSLSDLSGSPSDIGAESVSNKGVPNGYASLDASGNISVEQMQFSIEFWDSEL